MLRRGDSCLELAVSVLMLVQAQVEVQVQALALAGEVQGPASGMEPGCGQAGVPVLDVALELG